MKMNSNVLLAGAIISLVAFFPFPVGFYTFTRIAISLCSAYAAYCFYKDGKNIWIIMVLVTILYNPILPVYLYDRGLWQILNILTALIFIYSSGLRPDKNSNIFLYVGRVILLGGLSFWGIAAYYFYTEILNGYSEPEPINYVVLIILFILPFALSKLWNYFFLKNSKFWVTSIKEKEE